jgi:hypothetical protein
MHLLYVPVLGLTSSRFFGRSESQQVFFLSDLQLVDEGMGFVGTIALFFVQCVSGIFSRSHTVRVWR